MNRQRPQAYSEHIRGDYWAKVKKAIFRRGGGKCERCGTDHRYAVLDCHHTSYDHFGHELEHLDEIQLICRDCHDLLHGRSEYDPRKITGDGWAEMIISELRKL